MKAYLAAAEQKIGMREIARAFGVGPDDKKGLRELMKTLAADGVLELAGRKRYREAGRLPETAVVEVTGIDRDGEALARPVVWDGPGRPPVIFMHAEARGQAALAPGARVLARLKPIGADKYEGRTLKRLAEQAGSIVGVFHPHPHGGRIEPTDRRQKAEWMVPPDETMGAFDNEIVRAEPLPGKPFGPKPARITERLGLATDARSVSLIAIATHGIPMEFPEAALKEAAKAKSAPLGQARGSARRAADHHRRRRRAGFRRRGVRRTHRRRLPADRRHRRCRALCPARLGARPRRQGARQFLLFPRPRGADAARGALQRLVLAQAGEDRGCLFVEMQIDVHGQKQSHRFGRGLMRSAARKTYEQVQAEFEADPTQHAHLYAAHAALSQARLERGTLDLDLPERKVELDADGPGEERGAPRHGSTATG